MEHTSVSLMNVIQRSMRHLRREDWELSLPAKYSMPAYNTAQYLMWKQAEREWDVANQN